MKTKNNLYILGLGLLAATPFLSRNSEISPEEEFVFPNGPMTIPSGPAQGGPVSGGPGPVVNPNQPMTIPSGPAQGGPVSGGPGPVVNPNQPMTIPSGPAQGGPVSGGPGPAINPNQPMTIPSGPAQGGPVSGGPGPVITKPPLEPGPVIPPHHMKYNTYSSNRYKLSFDYPRTWVKNPRRPNKYEGPYGFFEVNVYEGPNQTIRDAVTNLINQPYLPYGSSPVIRFLQVDRRPAALIYASNDQIKPLREREVTLVVQYPIPLIIGPSVYNFALVWSDRQNMPSIVRSFRFLD